MGRHSKARDRGVPPEWKRHPLTIRMRKATRHLPEILGFAAVSWATAFVMSMSMGMALADAAMMGIIAARVIGTMVSVLHMLDPDEESIG